MMDAAESLAQEADRVVAAAAGTRQASDTYKLMMATRLKVFRGETLTFFTGCLVPQTQGAPASGLVVLTNQMIHFSHFSPSGDVEHLAIPRDAPTAVHWRAVTIEDGYQVAVVAGLPDLGIPPTQASIFESLLTSAHGIETPTASGPTSATDGMTCHGLPTAAQQAIVAGGHMPDDSGIAATKLRAAASKEAGKSSLARWEESTSPLTSPERLKALARNRDETVRRNVAANPSTAPSVLKSLASDRHVIVREAVASNAHTPPSVLRRLRDDVGSVHVRLASNPSSPEDLLDELAAANQQELLRAVAENPFATETQFTHCIEVLLQGEYLAPREAHACLRNPEVNPMFLLRPSESADPEVRAAVASNPVLPALVLTRMASDEHPAVRDAVAANPNTPENVLLELALSEDLGVRWSVSANPSAPAAALELLCLDLDDDVRLGVADNAATPSSVLESLALDPDEDVAVTARESLRRGRQSP